MHYQVRRPHDRYLGGGMYQHGPMEAEFAFDEAEIEMFRRDPIDFYYRSKQQLERMGIKPDSYEMHMFEDAVRKMTFERAPLYERALRQDRSIMEMYERYGEDDLEKLKAELVIPDIHFDFAAVSDHFFWSLEMKVIEEPESTIKYATL